MSKKSYEEHFKYLKQEFVYLKGLYSLCALNTINCMYTFLILHITWRGWSSQKWETHKYLWKSVGLRFVVAMFDKKKTCLKYDRD